MDLKQIFFELTPLGRASLELEEHLKNKVDREQRQKYQKSLKRYRDLKIIQTFFRVLLYASVLTAIATTVGFREFKLLEKLASYIGTTMTLLMYGLNSYIALIAKESYHVQREIIVAKAT